MSVQTFVHTALRSLVESEQYLDKVWSPTETEATDTLTSIFHELTQQSKSLQLLNVSILAASAVALVQGFSTVNTVTKEQQQRITVLLYKTIDGIRLLLHHVVQTPENSPDTPFVSEIITSIHQMLQEVQESNIPSYPDFHNNESIKTILFAEKNNGFSGIQDESAPEVESPLDEEFFLQLSREALTKYISEAADLVNTAENVCLRLEEQPNNQELIDELFRHVHTLKGNSGFVGQAEIEDHAIDLEVILDAMRNKSLEISPQIVSIILNNLDIIRHQIEHLQKFEVPVVVSSKTHSPAQISAPHTGTDNKPQQKAEPDQQQPVQKQSLKKKSGKTPAASDIPKQPPVLAQDPPQKHRETVSAAPLKQDIRIDTGKVDRLFNLVGELITVETMIRNHPDVVSLDSTALQRSLGQLNKVTRELQEVTMTMRMMPLDGLFNKMRRLVRDLAQKFQKNLQFNVSGAETEMDKSIIEEISDPLMHIIRNAVDHGIEPSSQERINGGKPESASLSLSARYEGNEIVLDIEDDGRGLQREKIIRKAKENGLISLTTNTEILPDSEIWKWIFEPGFSTAEQVSDVSGRGVGMDVVKKNIEKLHGRISIESWAGQGTRISLRIPLTLAIMDGMLVRVGGNIYAIPLLGIRESLRVRSDAITQMMDGAQLIRLRNAMIPVVRLHQALSVRPDTVVLEEGIMVIVESRTTSAALFVDEILGQQQIVVKALSHYIGSVRGITGCMILANGDVGLILDVETIINYNSTH